jgi:hypothetical protein
MDHAELLESVAQGWPTDSTEDSSGGQPSTELCRTEDPPSEDSTDPSQGWACSPRLPGKSHGSLMRAPGMRWCCSLGPIKARTQFLIFCADSVSKPDPASQAAEGTLSCGSGEQFVSPPPGSANTYCCSRLAPSQNARSSVCGALEKEGPAWKPFLFSSVCAATIRNCCCRSRAALFARFSFKTSRLCARAIVTGHAAVWTRSAL